MRIFINGDPREVPQGINMSELVQLLDLLQLQEKGPRVKEGD